MQQNKCLREVVQILSLEIWKPQLDRALSSLSRCPS